MQSETMENGLIGDLVDTKYINADTVFVAGSFYHFIPKGLVRDPIARLRRYHLSKVTGVRNGKLVLSPVTKSKKK